MSLVDANEVLRVSQELVSPPEIYTRLQELLADPDWTPEEVAHVIEHDPGLSGRLLKLVNSPLYGLTTRVISIPHAISLVGIRDLRDLVLGTSVMKSFRDLPEDLFSVSAFWHTSLRNAVMARSLAQHHPAPEKLEAVFVAGLLADVGQLVLFRVLPEPSRKALLQAGREAEGLLAAERQIIGCDHAEVGARLMQEWGLPEVLWHVAEGKAGRRPADEYANQADLVRLAARINRLLYGPDAENDGRDAQRIEQLDEWQRLGLPSSVLGDTLIDAEPRFEAAVSAMLGG